MKLRSLFLTYQTARIVAMSGIYIGTWIALWHISKIMNILSGVSLWYPPAGMTFAALLGFGWRCAPLPFIASLLAGWSLWSWHDWSYYLMANASPVIIYGTAAQILYRCTDDRWNFNRPRYLAMFLAATVGASLLTASIGTAILVAAGHFAAEYMAKAIISWWIGDLIGLITVTPVLFLIAVPMARRFIAENRCLPPVHTRYPLRKTTHPSLIVLQIFASLGALALVFWLSFLTRSGQAYPFAYLLLLFPLAWIVNTGGIRSACIAIFLYEISIVAVLTLTGMNHTALEYQHMMIALATTGLLMGTLVQERTVGLTLYRDLAQISNDLFWEFDTRGRLKSTSGELAKRLSLQQSIGSHWRQYISNETSDDLKKLLTAIKQHKPFQNFVLHLQLPNQNSVWTSNSGLPLFNDEGRFIGYRGTTSDIGELKKAEMVINEYNKVLTHQVAERTEALIKSHEKLVMSEKRFRALSAAAPVGISEIDLNCRCVFVNQHWCELTDLSPREALNIHLIDIVHPEDRSWVASLWDNWTAARQLEISHLNKNILTLEYRIQRPDNRLAWVLGNAVVLRDNNSNIIGYIKTITDITKTKKKEEQTWKLANYDNITGLANRNLFFDRLEHILKSAGRTQIKVGLLLIDLDGFKKINDTFGHAKGDELLRQVGQRIQKRLRTSDVAARIGGDEFTVILPNLSNMDAAEIVADKIVTVLAQPFQLGNTTATVSASVGIAIYPDHTDSIDKLVKIADNAMYTAKRTGKNAFCLYHKSTSNTQP